MVQDGGLELDQPRSRIDAELFDEEPTNASERTQRVGLPSAPILRGDEDLPAPFPQRLGSHERLRVRGDGDVLTGSQAGVEQLLLGAQAKLIQTGRFAAARLPLDEVLERRTPPQRQRGGKRGRARWGWPVATSARPSSTSRSKRSTSTSSPVTTSR